MVVEFNSKVHKPLIDPTGAVKFTVNGTQPNVLSTVICAEARPAKNTLKSASRNDFLYLVISLIVRTRKQFYKVKIMKYPISEKKNTNSETLGVAAQSNVQTIHKIKLSPFYFKL